MIQVERFSTAGLRPSERLACWNDALMARIGPVASVVSDRSEFNASLEQFRFPEFEILLTSCAAARTMNRACDSNPDVLNLTLQYAGRSWNSTGGRTCFTERDDIVLYDPGQALELRTTESTQAIVVRMPIARAEYHVPGLQKLVGIPVRGNGGGGAILASFLRSVWAELHANGAAEWTQGIGDAFWGLLPLAYALDNGLSTQSVGRDKRWREVRSIVDRGLSENQFGAHAIAAEMGVTVRYVQMMFARMATTPTAYIQRRRVERAAAILRQRGHETPITEVAFDVGFSDASSFSRAFRRFYQLAPRVYRARARRGNVPPDPQPLLLTPYPN
jgi:AraC-like DNA-binding protein